MLRKFNEKKLINNLIKEKKITLLKIWEENDIKKTVSYHETMQEIFKQIVSDSGLRVYRIVAIQERTIPKTTSGKIKRRGTKAALHNSELKVIYDFDGTATSSEKCQNISSSSSTTTANNNIDPFEILKDVTSPSRARKEKEAFRVSDWAIPCRKEEKEARCGSSSSTSKNYAERKV